MLVIENLFSYVHVLKLFKKLFVWQSCCKNKVFLLTLYMQANTRWHTHRERERERERERDTLTNNEPDYDEDTDAAFTHPDPPAHRWPDSASAVGACRIDYLRNTDEANARPDNAVHGHVDRNETRHWAVVKVHHSWSVHFNSWLIWWLNTKVAQKPGQGNGRFPDNHFFGHDVSRKDVSRTSACPDSSIISRIRRFPANDFPGQTFPGQFV